MCLLWCSEGLVEHIALWDTVLGLLCHTDEQLFTLTTHLLYITAVIMKVKVRNTQSCPSLLTQSRQSLITIASEGQTV